MSRGETQELLRLLRNIGYFLLPIIVILALPLVVLWKSGELSSLARIIALQQNSSVLAGFAYSYPAPYYKLHSILALKPEIIALGTSRVMQLRQEFFSRGLFFNAGGGLSTVKDPLLFLERIPKESPLAVIILQLDQNFFNQAWDRRTVGNRNRKLLLDTYDGPGNIFLSSWRSVYRDILNGKITFAALFSENTVPLKIGLGARMHNNGFRNDGSYQDGASREAVTPGSEERLSVALSQLKEKQGTFVSGTEVDGAALGTLESFLSRANGRGIRVIGLLPPFAPSIYAKAYADPELRYLPKLAASLGPVFQKYSFDFFDFSDGETFHSSDEEMLDGVHGSEKTYLRLFIAMAEKSEALRPYVDVVSLKRQLNLSVSPFVVFK